MNNRQEWEMLRVRPGICSVLVILRPMASSPFGLPSAAGGLDPWLAVVLALAVVVIILTVLLIRERRRAAPPPPTEAPAEAPAPSVTAPIEQAPTQPMLRGVPVAATLQFLEARAVDSKLRRFSLDRPLLAIGRAPDNDIVIGDEFAAASSVMDHHARIRQHDMWVIVEAASPDAAVLVNGRRTGRNILRNGWHVTLGELTLTFQTGGLGTAPLTELEDEETVRLARAPQPLGSEFAPLPEGALLADHYIILTTHPESPSLNRYVAESLQPVLYCAQCGYDANKPELKTCRNCGASLVGSVPCYPHYSMIESRDEGDLGVERQLVGLSHPNVLLPREVFTEAPYGETMRHYVVRPEAPPQLAANVRVPQEMPQVIEWAQQLAQGMAYLHSNGVTLGAIDPWRVALDSQQARWVDLALCEFVAENARPVRFARDVRALAEIAYYLITGKRQYDESILLSPPGVGMLFDRVLGRLETPTASQFLAALQAGLIEVRRPSSVDVRVGRLTDVGQARQLNEDSLLTIEISRVRRSISEPLGLYAVCDGMGGHAAGDVASALAVQTLARKALAEVMSDGIAEGTRPNWEAWLKSAIQEANQAVFGHRRSSSSDMGTTCVAALVHGGTATISHAGDSRCYLINDQGIRQLTTDHSLVQRLIQMKQLTPEEARTHPQRNVIYKNIGDKPAVEPDVMTQPLAAGDRLLLCSDGLSGMVEDDQIRQMVMWAHSPQEACRQLVAAANAAGGEDNISVIVVQMEALG